MLIAIFGNFVAICGNLVKLNIASNCKKVTKVLCRADHSVYCHFWQLLS